VVTCDFELLLKNVFASSAHDKDRTWLHVK